MINRYYHIILQRLLKFLIPENQKILYLGCHEEQLICSLKPSSAILVNAENVKYHVSDNIVQHIYCRYHRYKPTEKFDYIVLDAALGKTENINLLLKNMAVACTRHTRIIIHLENYLWRPVLNLASAFGWKKLEKIQNWLSIKDVETYLKAAGFETTRTYKKTIVPFQLGFVGQFTNYFFSLVPILDFLKLNQFVVARYLSLSQPPITTPNGLTICITVKDEEKNIEPIVATLPVLCDQQEILFVEGSSSDNTSKEIERMKMLFPHKNIRLIKQKGIGQGDAIQTGFRDAKGDIIILYEGDGTSDPGDIQYFYDAMRTGRFEFIEGSRFVYPLSHASMPFINKVGNVLFAKWFSFFLNQRTTDVLSGIKAVLKKDFEKINNSWGFMGVPDPFGDFELLFGSARYGLKIGEIPIRYKPRMHGISKTKVFGHGWYLLKMAIAGYFIFRNSKIREL